MATTGSASAATGTTTAKRKPVFVKVEQLKPGTTGHTLTVKVVDANPVVPVTRKARPGASMGRPSQPSRIAECLIGDETGCILFTARNDQGYLLTLFVLLEMVSVMLLKFDPLYVCSRFYLRQFVFRQ